MSVAVIVPWRGGDPHREAAWSWLATRLELQQPNWPVRLAAAPGGDWIKAKAAMPAVEDCDADVVVMHDADVWCDGLELAVQRVASGKARWAVPHDQVYRVDDAGTQRVLRGADWRAQPLDQPAYVGRWGGGVLVAARDTLLDVPLDPRFVGWGREDEAHGIALHHLVGSAWRGSAPLVHLWHPPQARASRKHGSEASTALFLRYANARQDLDQMRELVEEAKHALRDDESAVHDPAADRVG